MPKLKIILVIKLKLHWQIFIGILLAFIYGIFFREYIEYVAWMGDIFLRALKMIVIPLILTSIITGITNIGNDKSLGRLGLKTIIFYVFSTLFAIAVSMILVNLIKPGEGMDISSQLIADDLNIKQQSLKQTLINIVPENIFASFVENKLLSVILIAVVIGVAITRLSQKNKNKITGFFSSFFELFMKITMFVIKLAPLGVFGLVAKVVAEQEDVAQMLMKLGMLTLTITAAIFIHAFITLPLILRFIAKVKPFRHFNNMGTALLTAFSTASSAATLPLTMNGVRERSKVSDKITNFTLPIGATINMDGTAIYICAVVMFIAQVQGLTLGLSQQLTIVLTTLLVSIGTAAVPMASLVIMTLILGVLGIPYELIALVFPVDRPLDMLRTSTNVWSDSCAAVVIAKSEGEKLDIDRPDKSVNTVI